MCEAEQEFFVSDSGQHLVEKKPCRDDWFEKRKKSYPHYVSWILSYVGSSFNECLSDAVHNMKHYKETKQPKKFWVDCVSTLRRIRKDNHWYKNARLGWFHVDDNGNIAKNVRRKYVSKKKTPVGYTLDMKPIYRITFPANENPVTQYYVKDNGVWYKETWKREKQNPHYYYSGGKLHFGITYENVVTKKQLGKKELKKLRAMLEEKE